MLVSEFYTGVQDLIGDPSALRTSLMLRIGNRKLQELARKFKCKFNLRQGTISCLEPSQTTTYRARSSNVSTITTVVAHGYRTGEYVTIDGMGGTGYDDDSVAIASVPSTTTFTYANTGDDEGSTADTAGTVTLLGRTDYNLPQDFYKPAIGYDITEGNYLKHITYVELRKKYPDFTSISNGTPTHYAVKKISYVDAQPFAASKVAYSATETITLRIRGLVSGVIMDESLSCTSGGTNSSTYTYDANGLISITAATAPTASITCTTNSAIVTVLTLGIGQKEKQRVVATIYPPADDDYTLYFDYFALPQDLSSSTDRVPLPKPYEEWLIYVTAGEILKIDGRKESNEYMAMAKDLLKQMTDDEMLEPDEQWSMWPSENPNQEEF